MIKTDAMKVTKLTDSDRTTLWPVSCVVMLLWLTVSGLCSIQQVCQKIFGVSNKLISMPTQAFINSRCSVNLWTVFPHSFFYIPDCMHINLLIIGLWEVLIKTTVKCQMKLGSAVS